jgi:hypothetical protein
MSHEPQSESMEHSRIESLTKLVNAIDGERGLFWFLLICAGYMFVTAAQFPPAAQLFPRLTAGTVLVAGAVRFAINRLDIDIQRSESDVFGGETHDRETMEVTNIDTMIVLGILITGYIIGGYFVGLFWVTPLFVLGYMTYTGQPWWRTLLVTVIMTGIAYGFMIIMNLDLMTGNF